MKKRKKKSLFWKLERYLNRVFGGGITVALTPDSDDHYFAVRSPRDDLDAVEVVNVANRWFKKRKLYWWPFDEEDA